MMAASTLIIGRISGVGRPTIGAEMPNVNGICYLYDVGASKDSKPIHLFEYAVMGTIFAMEMGGVSNPKVGVLSMGEEEGKGNEISEAAAKLLKESKLNFIGNVEGIDILAGSVDVVVCDGFVGNIILKFRESVPKLLKHLLTKTAERNFIDKLLIGLSKGVLKKSLKSLDYQEYGRNRSPVCQYAFRRERHSRVCHSLERRPNSNVWLEERVPSKLAGLL